MGGAQSAADRKRNAEKPDRRSSKVKCRGNAQTRQATEDTGLKLGNERAKRRRAMVAEYGLRRFRIVGIAQKRTEQGSQFIESFIQVWQNEQSLPIGVEWR